MVKKNASGASAPSSLGHGSVCVGDDTTDTDCSLEAPRRPRSEAQIAAFEKAKAKRAANLAASAPAVPPPAPAAPAAPPPAPAAPPPAPAAPAAPPLAPAAKPRKARTDKGKKRGYLVRESTRGSPPSEEEEYPPPRSGYGNFVIV